MTAPESGKTTNTNLKTPDNYDDEDDYISTTPFVELPQFSRGLSRYPINFVPAASPTEALPAPQPTTSIADQYLSIVFPNGRPTTPSGGHEICPTCNLPIKEASASAHHLSIGHQMALPKAPTPSGIDRTRMGLKYMEKHGFDVDARKGLGAAGAGMLYPIQAKEKADKLGIGVPVKEPAKVKEIKEVRLNAGEVRKKALVDKRNAAKLQKMFYGDEKVEKYLGELEGAAGPGFKVDWGVGKKNGKKSKR